MLAALALAAACAGGETGGRTQLRFQVAGETEEVAVYKALINVFARSNPNIDVNLVAVADKDDHLAKLTTSFATGAAPDVFLVNFREFSQFVARDALEPVGPLLAEKDVSFGDYFPQPLVSFTYGDELQCMPQNISSLVVYYNVKLFKDAGLGRPPRRWGWEEFRATAVELTRGDVHGLGIEPSVIRAAPFVWSNGGDIVDDLDAPTRFTLDEPEAVEALRFIISLVREDEVVPGENDVAAQDLQTRFAAGKLGMLLSSRRDTPVFREVLGLDWDVAALPVGPEGRAGILHSDGYCLPRGGDAQDAALEFVEFATGVEGQTITALGGRTVPSLRRVARSGAFLDPTQPPAHSNVFLQGIPSIRRTPTIPTWPQIEDLAEEIFTRMFYEEGYSIEHGLQELEEQTTLLFEAGSQP